MMRHLALVAALAALAGSALAQPVPSNAVALWGRDSGTGLLCVVGATATCQLPTPSGGGGGGGGSTGGSVGLPFTISAGNSAVTMAVTSSTANITAPANAGVVRVFNPSTTVTAYVAPVSSGAGTVAVPTSSPAPGVVTVPPGGMADIVMGANSNLAAIGSGAVTLTVVGGSTNQTVAGTVSLGAGSATIGGISNAPTTWALGAGASNASTQRIEPSSTAAADGGYASGVGSAAINTAQVSCTTSATLVVAARTGANGTGRILASVEQSGTTAVYIGPAGVTTSTGVLLPGTVGAAVNIPTQAALYCIVASGTQTVTALETY